MVGAIQVPIILMSQNRHSERDRILAEHDYEVNLKVELEIMLQYEKIDHPRGSQCKNLMKIQNAQLRCLAEWSENKA
jgi:uncharacterized membrane protein